MARTKQTARKNTSGTAGKAPRNNYSVTKLQGNLLQPLEELKNLTDTSQEQLLKRNRKYQKSTELLIRSYLSKDCKRNCTRI